MRVKVPVVHYEYVEISDQQAKEIAIDFVRKVYDIPSACFVKDGTVVEEIEQYGGTHSWTEKRNYRPATDRDVIVIAFIEDLKSTKV
jgi:hypothetical protein